jgi:hypothetical protein
MKTGLGPPAEAVADAAEELLAFLPPPPPKKP